MKILPAILAGVLIFGSFSVSQAAPFISEFMSSNDTVLADEDGEFSDWIEIHNPDAAAVNLDGYSLTDDAGDLSQWDFPAVEIAAGGYLVIFASNKDRTDPAGELHTNFKLSASGGYLALSGPAGIVSEFGPTYSEQFEDQSYGVGSFGSVTPEALVGLGSTTNYLIPTDGALGTTWQGVAFDDSSWATGTSGLGFDGGNLNQFISTDLSSVMRNINPTGYFRFPFSYSSTGKQLQALTLAVHSDDGFVAYLNGVKIGSLYEPGSLEWNSLATGSDSDQFVIDNPSTHTIPITPGVLNDGDGNVLAIHGMNSSFAAQIFLSARRLLRPSWIPLAPSVRVTLIRRLRGNKTQVGKPPGLCLSILPTSRRGRSPVPI